MKKIVTAALAAGSLWCGILGYGNYKTSMEHLRQNANFRESERIECIQDTVESAESDLTYHHAYTTHHRAGKVSRSVHHPARYPNTMRAHTNITNALQAQSHDASVDGLLTEVDYRIPRSEKLQEWNGKKVDNTTFAAERGMLSSAEDRLAQTRAHLRSLVPEHLYSARTNAIWVLVAAGLLGAGAVGFGVSAYNDSSYGGYRY
mgnify:CR=1 FL=1